ncbi:MAG: heme-binding domain-containing protein [Bacteroidetes bacterium]|nr:heme-binding domain-containing protein [Bacteroidota bacterium]
MKRILLILIIIIIVLQFFKSEKNIHPGIQPNNIAALYTVPADIDSILVKACNDCHSNNSRYPWYNNIQPVAWWMKSHIDDGKDELNFDEFSTYSLARQYHKLEEIKEQIEKDEMPIKSYTITHGDARLTTAEKNTLVTWSEGIRKQMETKYPKDSLIRKRR